MSKVYFYHTTKLEVVKNKERSAATIAVQKVGDQFKYGIALCSKYDNFSRKKGRELAQQRLEAGFASMKTPTYKKTEAPTEEQECLTALFNLASSVVVKETKWKKRLEEFNHPVKTKKASKKKA